MVITNTKECGRPTDEFLELTAGLNYPVTFVSEKVSKEIIAMRDQVLELRRQREARKDGLHRFEFVYVSAMDDGLPRLRHMLVRILASTHVLLTTVAVLAILVYFCLACSVGSLRNVPREIAPSIFGSRPEPVDQATIERLPLVQVEWDVPPSDSCRCTPSVDEESRHETPDIPSQPPPCPEKQVVQRQLASIIQTCGASSYSFTDEVMCAICLGRYTLQESLRLLPCKHAFHQKCIDAWLLSKDMTVHCPVCKCSIVDGLRLLDKHGYNEILNSLNQDPVPDQLQARYDLARELCLKDPVCPASTDARQHFRPTARDIFANTEVQLSKVRTYGLDLDYTLASYTEKLPETIYTMIRDVLVNSMLYPPALKALKYDSSFAIRGISYDRETGWLFKLDSNYNIAMDTIHYGREPLRDLEDVFALHGGPHLAPDYVKNHLYQLNDMYSVPEATLLADIIQYFSDNDISFHPRYLAEDIRAAGEYIHRGDGVSASPLHATIMNNIGDYLNRAPELLHILESLKREGKRLFLLTNSGYKYVDTVLSYMFNTSDWRDVFDVAIVSARKPGWYLSHRPFRLVPTRSGARASSVQPWELVDRFEDGQVYSGGNLASFTSITGYAD
ncbi:hypothetical protein H4S02_004473, partial [Coemansia sp. RSA 2611]